MGNKSTITSNFKWSPRNTKKILIHKHTVNNVTACVAYKDPQNDDQVITISTALGNIILSHVHIKQKGKSSKMKIISKQIKTQNPNPITAVHVMAISPSCSYLACDAPPDNIHLYKIDKQTNFKLHNKFQFQQTPPVTDIKFINDDLFLTSIHNSVILWNVNIVKPIPILNGSINQEISSIDCVNIHNLYIMAYGSKDANVYVRDITDNVLKGKHMDIDDDNDDQKLNNANYMFPYNPNAEKYCCPAGIVDGFYSYVNCVSFSSNGDYLAACSDDARYTIFYKNYKYDSFWNITNIEWNKLITVSDMDVFASVKLIKWVDDNTVIAGYDDEPGLLVTQITNSKNDPLLIKTLNECIQTIIESFSNINMQWVGLTKYISNVILLYVSDLKIFNYRLDYAPYSVISMATCKYGTNNSKHMYIVGTKKTELYGYFRNHNVDQYKLDDQIKTDNDVDHALNTNQTANYDAYDDDYYW